MTTISGNIDPMVCSNGPNGGSTLIALPTESGVTKAELPPSISHLDGIIKPDEIGIFDAHDCPKVDILTLSAARGIAEGRNLLGRRTQEGARVAFLSTMERAACTASLSRLAESYGGDPGENLTVLTPTMFDGLQVLSDEEGVLPLECMMGEHDVLIADVDALLSAGHQRLMEMLNRMKQGKKAMILIDRGTQIDWRDHDAIDFIVAVSSINAHFDEGLGFAVEWKFNRHFRRRCRVRFNIGYRKNGAGLWRWSLISVEKTGEQIFGWLKA